LCSDVYELIEPNGLFWSDSEIAVTAKTADPPDQVLCLPLGTARAVLLNSAPSQNGNFGNLRSEKTIRRA